MEGSNEIRQLLEEIRDIQQGHFAEYKRVTRQMVELNEASIEMYKANLENDASRYRASLKEGQSSWLAILILVAVCLVTNMIMCASTSHSLGSIESVVARAMERNR